MSVLDVFNGNAFNTLSLTTALDKIPFEPSFLESLGIFTNRSITDKVAMIDERQGRLTLLNTSQRGGPGQTTQRPDRNARAIPVPHIKESDTLLAEAIQGVRRFGSENQNETMAEIVLQRLEEMRANVRVTKEWHRIGAIQGIVLDGDGATEIYNWFTEFGIVETVVDFVLSVATTDLKGKCTEVIRNIENALGGTPFNGVIGFAGDNWWDEFVSHAKIEAAYERWQANNQQGEFLRTSQRGAGGGFAGQGGQPGFMFAGIMFFNYRGVIDGQQFIDNDICRFFPTGARGLYDEVYAPADYEETVNTLGLSMYAKQERMEFDVGRKLQVQSNPLIMPLRPASLIKGTKS